MHRKRSALSREALWVVLVKYFYVHLIDGAARIFLTSYAAASFEGPKFRTLSNGRCAIRLCCTMSNCTIKKLFQLNFEFFNPLEGFSHNN